MISCSPRLDYFSKSILNDLEHLDSKLPGYAKLMNETLYLKKYFSLMNYIDGTSLVRTKTDEVDPWNAFDREHFSYFQTTLEYYQNLDVSTN
jgi:hypothetical protein